MAALMAAAVTIAFLAVIFRYVIGQSLSWSFEALLALLTYMTFIGAYLALRRGAHLRINLIVKLLPPIGQTGVFVFNQVVIGLVALVMLLWGGEQALKFAARTTTVMQMPLGPLYAIVPLSGMAMLVESVIAIVRGLRRVRAGLPAEREEDQFSLDV